jgi:hypothetical protein
MILQSFTPNRQIGLETSPKTVKVNSMHRHVSHCLDEPAPTHVVYAWRIITGLIGP